MTLLGVSASNNAGAVVNRSCGSGYIISCVEAKVATDSGSAFTFGADRRHYDDITNSWPPNADNVFGRLSGHATADWEMGRLPVMSSKYAGATWAQVASAASGTIYNNIVARGNAIKTWQDVHLGLGIWGCTFAWTFHHEPNNDSGGAGMAVTDWQNAIQNIVTIWQGLGVRFWTGENDGTTTSEGIILSINLITGETSGGYQNDWATWWPTSHAWMNNNMVCAAGDGYNNGDVFKPLSYIFQTFKSWTDAKRTSQASAGKPFLAAIWETGCQADSFYSSSHSTWTATGLSRTKTNWFENMADYIEASWPLLHHLCYWDSLVVMIWTLDTTQTDWDGFVAISHHAAFTEANVTTLPAGTTTYSAHTTVAVGDTLRFPPGSSATLIMDNKNLIIEGTLEMKPQSSSVTHLLQFTNVDEQIMTGGAIGGMGTPTTTDIGLWVMNNGILDAIGTPRVGWNRTGNDTTWLSTDEMLRVPWNNSSDFVAHTKGTTPESLVDPWGVTHTREVMNLTRNVRIEGTPGHNTHVFIRTDVAQTIKYIQLRYVGPRHLTGGSDVSVVLRGRWGIHLHHLEDAGYDTLIEGVVVRDNPSHAFVSHGTNGTTFRDCISYLVSDDSYWWDNETGTDVSADVTYDHCMAAKLIPIPSFRGIDLAGFFLGPTSGTINDCVAVGNMGNVNAAGFVWPEVTASGTHGLWDGSGNVSHNNNREGVYMWQNDELPHDIVGMTCFRNGDCGILFGAYENSVHFEDLCLFDNAAPNLQAETGGDLQLRASNALVPPNNMRFDNCYLETVHHTNHVLAQSGGPGVFAGGDIVTMAVYQHGNTNKVDYDFAYTGLEQADITGLGFAPTGVIRVQRLDATAFRVNPDMTFSTIGAFYHYISTLSLSAATQNVAYSQTLVSLLNVGAVTWRIKTGSAALPTGLSLSTGGVISGTPSVVGTFPVTIEAVDSYNRIAPRAFSLVVNGNVALSITTSSLPNGFVGTSYSQTLVATGGTGSGKVWTLVSGTLPAGVGLSTGGVISGTPSTAASYSFTVRVTDSGANTATRSFSVTISAAAPTITTSTPLPTGEIGFAYNTALTASGGTAPYTWSTVSGTLPAGLSRTGAVISGTPTTVTSTSVTFRVTDANNLTNDKTFAIATTAAVVFVGATPFGGKVKVPYSYTFTAQNGVVPYTFTAGQTAQLPPGLTLATTGELSGTPTSSGTFAFQAQVIDAVGALATANVSVTIETNLRKPTRSLALRGLSRIAPVH